MATQTLPAPAEFRNVYLPLWQQGQGVHGLQREPFYHEPRFQELGNQLPKPQPRRGADDNGRHSPPLDTPHPAVG